MSDGSRTTGQAVQVAIRGISTAKQFIEFTNALSLDLLEDRVSVEKVHALCNIAKRQIEIMKLEFRYGHHDSTDFLISR
jgi:hypothetical protein